MIYLVTACIYAQTGYTPLFWACYRGLSDVAQLLINKGANMDVTNKVSYHNRNNLNISCHLLGSRCAITTHVSINVYHLTACKYTQTERTPLVWACKNGLSDVAQLLINKGAHMDVSDEVSYHNKNKLT